MEPRRRFRFLKELSEGAFGKVYLAEMVTGDNFKSVVAIKLLHGKWAGHEEIVQRSRDEARVLGLLHHRNIIRVEDLTSISGQVAIIMEYLNGVDLKSLVAKVRDKGDRVPRKVAFDICAQVASALEAAYYHRPLQGGDPLLLIHRDIKPSNVMLTVAGDVKVLDFGTAQARFDDREAHTQALAFGSAAYMAPERLLGDPDAPSGDIFSLGITLYELLAMTGLGKIHIRPEKFEVKIEQRIEELDLSDLPPERADQVRSALRLMLSYEPKERPTATQVVELLEALADEIHDGSMRRFCRETVAPIRELLEPAQDPDDPLTGSTLFEDSGALLERIVGADSSRTWMDDTTGTLVEEVPGDAGGFEEPTEPGYGDSVIDPSAPHGAGASSPDSAEVAAAELFSTVEPTVTMGEVSPPDVDAETVRMSPEEARKLLEDEARAAKMPAAHVGAAASNPPTSSGKKPDRPAPSEEKPAPAQRSTSSDRAPSATPKIQSALREPPAPSGGKGRSAAMVLGLVGVLAAGVGGAYFLGFIPLGDGPAEEPVPEAATNEPAAERDPNMVAGGTIEVGEPSDDRAVIRLELRQEGRATVDLRSNPPLDSYKLSWDGTGQLELRGLEAGQYTTKVKPVRGGRSSRVTLQVEPDSDCTYVYDLKQSDEWVRDCQ